MSYQILLSYIPELVNLLNQKTQELDQMKFEFTKLNAEIANQNITNINIDKNIEEKIIRIDNTKTDKLSTEINELKNQLNDLKTMERKINKSNTCVEILNKVLIKDRSEEINKLSENVLKSTNKLSKSLAMDKLGLEIFSSKLDQINYQQIIEKQCMI